LADAQIAWNVKSNRKTEKDLSTEIRKDNSASKTLRAMKDIHVPRAASFLQAWQRSLSRRSGLPASIFSKSFLFNQI
jgi:hypothetical protein